MPTFDQRNQNVNYQYNANGNINFKDIESLSGIKAELDKLRQELLLAMKNSKVDDETATDAKYMLDKAYNETNKTNPDHVQVLAYLERLKEIIGGIGVLTGLVTGITEAIVTIKKFIP